MTEPSQDTHWVGFDLGGTKMLATVLNRQFEIVGRERHRTKAHQGAETGVARMIEAIRGALDDAGTDPRQLGGIGVGCPGPLDLDAGVILNTPNLGWENVPLADLLREEFGCPVMVLNDVDAGVYGEYRMGAAAGAHCAVGVFPGTGIGGGCVYEGRILRGKTGSCMEIGHMQVVADGPLCGCGRHGCLEAVASRLAISAAAAAAAYRGQAPKLLAASGTTLSDIRSGAISDAVAAGDEVVRQLVLDAARHIGTAVGSVVNLLAPDIVVLGGGLVEAIPDLLVEGVTNAARQRAMPVYADTFQVVAAQLGDNATVKGAAAWVEAMVKRAS